MRLGEAMAGTAPHAKGVLAIEDPGPWGPKVPSGSAWLPPAVARQLDEQARANEVRIQLIRRHGRRVRDQGTYTVLVAHTGPEQPWLERLSVSEPSDLLDIDLTALTTPDPPDIGYPDRSPHMLVCTHGRRDRCCARSGRQLASALADRDPGIPVWETSHTGGHRFAPNLLVLPSGVLYGRVNTNDAVRTIEHVRSGRLMVDSLRGRLALVPAAQVADIEVRQASRLDSPSAVTLEFVAKDGNEVVVEAKTPEETVNVRLRHEPTGTPRPVSCDAEPKDPTSFTVSSLTHWTDLRD